MEIAYHKNCGGQVFLRMNRAIEEIYEVQMQNTLVKEPVLKLGELKFKILLETKQVITNNELSSYFCSICKVILLEQDMQVKFKNLILHKGGKDE